MSLLPFFSYFGAKQRLARIYPAPLHDTIIEPFAGAAGYALRHYRARVVLVEKDPSVAELWRFLIRASAREIMGLPELKPGERVSDVAGLSSGARLLLAFNVNQATGSARDTMTGWSPWAIAFKARVAAQVERIRHWKVIEGDYSLAPDVRATWFVDPPYQREGKHYRCGSADIDFAKLGRWCRSRKGQTIVCENDGAEWLPFRPFKAAWSARNADHISREVIWTNDETQKEAPEQEQARQRRRAAR